MQGLYWEDAEASVTAPNFMAQKNGKCSHYPGSFMGANMALEAWGIYPGVELGGSALMAPS